MRWLPSPSLYRSIASSWHYLSRQPLAERLGEAYPSFWPSRKKERLSKPLPIIPNGKSVKRTPLYLLKFHGESQSLVWNITLTLPISYGLLLIVKGERSGSGWTLRVFFSFSVFPSFTWLFPLSKNFLNSHLEEVEICEKSQTISEEPCDTPDFESEWFTMCSSENSSFAVSHNLGSTPERAKVLIKVIDGANAGYVFEGTGVQMVFFFFFFLFLFLFLFF